MNNAKYGLAEFPKMRVEMRDEMDGVISTHLS